VAPNSAGAITDGLGRLLSDPSLRRRLAEGALQTAAERRWDAVYDQLISDYRAAAAARATRAA
jgi:glycosyltransferase involved in cell wall biosynthesis